MADGNLPTRFPATRYRVTAEVERPFTLGDYGGAILRGALGAHLRNQVCITGQDDCRGCALYHRCAFPDLWLPPPPATHRAQQFSEIPVGYVIEPPPLGQPPYAAGDLLVFHLVLIGRSRRHLPLLMAALRAALADRIGAEAGQARLISITEDSGSLPEESPSSGLPEAPPCPASTRLEWLTPLRMQQDGKALRPEALRTDRLLMSLVKRTALLAEFHAEQPLPLDFRDLRQRVTLVQGTPELTPRRLRRYSSRQRKGLWLDGAMGHWTLAGPLEPFWPFLWWGQWLHVGKNTSFGLGAYRLHAEGSPSFVV